MKIVRKLSALETRAMWALKRSVRQLDQIKKANASQREILISPLVINLLNTWANFTRSYYICCALGTKRPDGSNVSSTLSAIPSRSINDAIGNAVQTFRPKASKSSNGEWDTRDEPTWHDVNILIQLASKYNFSNAADIKTAFTFGFTAHQHLVVFRNYYAHKNGGTRKKAQNIATKYSIRSNQHPSDILLDTPLSTPGTALIDIWIGELEQTVEILCS